MRGEVCCTLAGWRRGLPPTLWAHVVEGDGASRPGKGAVRPWCLLEDSWEDALGGREDEGARLSPQGERGESRESTRR